jgi:hypothetical protein
MQILNDLGVGTTPDERRSDTPVAAIESYIHGTVLGTCGSTAPSVTTSRTVHADI